MKTEIGVTPQTADEIELCDRIGEKAMQDLVLKAGADYIGQLLADIKAHKVKVVPKGPLRLCIETQLRVAVVNVDAAYKHLTDAATSEAPAVDTLGNREYYKWVSGAVLCEIMYPLQGGDFTKLSEDDQRTALLLAAEILYGPDHDHEILLEAVFWAKEDV